MNKKPFVTATVCRDLIPRVMSSAVVAGKKEVTMGKLKRKEQNVSSIWKVESLGYLALKGTESDSLGTLTTNGFSIASWHQFVCTACSYLLQSVDWEGLTLEKESSSRPYHICKISSKA